MTKRLLNRKETLVYIVLWAALFIAPLVSHYLHLPSDHLPTNWWHEVFAIWKTYAFFLILFLIHNFFLAPLLIYKRKTLLYILSALCLVGVLVAYQCTNRPAEPAHHMPPLEHSAEKPNDIAPAKTAGPRHHIAPPPDVGRHGKRPPLIWGEQDVVGVIMLILLLGMNLGVKLYFKSEDDLKSLHELERKNLEQQLEVLKYQINPHFLMNTLNNIHALVDINPDNAKESIVELSKLLRHILYKDAGGFITIDREIKFINHYLQLMRIRYADSVSIEANFPECPPERQIPSLVLITFVENAFKHGISYRRPSFIKINMTTTADRLTFTIDNSKHPADTNVRKGIGLDNVKKRLDILFADDYQLNITDDTDTYHVQLNMPTR